MGADPLQLAADDGRGVLEGENGRPIIPDQDVAQLVAAQAQAEQTAQKVAVTKRRAACRHVDPQGSQDIGKVDRIDRRIAAGRQQQTNLAFSAGKSACKMVDNLPFLQPGRGRLLFRRGQESGMGQPAAFFRLAGQVVQAVGQERFRHVSVLLPVCRPGSSGKAGAPPDRAG